MRRANQRFVDAVEADETNRSNEGTPPDEGLTGWVHKETAGYAIIYTGATKSMIETDYSKNTKLTCANGEKGESLGKFGVEHPTALVEDNQTLWFWFDLVETKSPMPLGLNYRDEAGADLFMNK